MVHDVWSRLEISHQEMNVCNSFTHCNSIVG